jgi:hypothetical protein
MPASIGLPLCDALLASGLLGYRHVMPAKKPVRRLDHEKLTIYLPPDMIEDVKLLAVRQRRTYSAVIEGFVADGLQEAKKDASHA